MFIDQNGKEHRCASPCHDGPCPPCTLEITALCRCGQERKQFSCKQVSADLAKVASNRNVLFTKE
eukprot:Pgem_evm1s14006